MCGISHDKIVETSLMMSWMLRMSSSSSHALVVCFGPNGQECQKELWCVIAACLSSLTYNLSLMTDTFIYKFGVWLLASKFISYLTIVNYLVKTKVHIVSLEYRVMRVIYFDSMYFLNIVKIWNDSNSWNLSASNQL